MPAKKTGRLSPRDQKIWQRYTLEGATLMELAEEFNVSNQRISQIINEISASLPPKDRKQVVDLRLDQINAMVAGLLPDIIAGDKDAIASWTKITEREAKYLGLDSAAKVELSGGVRYVIEGLEDDPKEGAASDPTEAGAEEAQEGPSEDDTDLISP